MPDRPGSARRPGHHRQRALSRGLIVDAAIALIEREGVEALTMRRLGAEVGVEAMSLYNHVDGRDALLAAIGDRMLEPLRDERFDGDWREACRAFAQRLRAIALAQPAVFKLVGLAPLDSPTSLDAVERLLGTLVRAGLDPLDALAAYRAVVSYARGYALAEATGFTVDAAGAKGRARLRALDSDAFPILAGRARELAGLNADAGFERGLRALVAGLPAPAAR